MVQAKDLEFFKYFVVITTSLRSFIFLITQQVKSIFAFGAVLRGVRRKEKECTQKVLLSSRN
jgi:hypothetical protein